MSSRERLAATDDLSTTLMGLEPEYVDDSTSESVLDTASENENPDFKKYPSSSGNPDAKKHPSSNENAINGVMRTHSSATNATVFTSSASFRVQSPTDELPTAVLTNIGNVNCAVDSKQPDR